jgi:hypothetical protein
MPACVLPVTEHTNHGVEEDAELALLVGHLLRPARVAEAAEPVVGRTGRDRVRLPSAGGDVLEGLLPALLEADPELGADEPHLGAQDPAE